jgi:hypothetical protein
MALDNRHSPNGDPAAKGIQQAQAFGSEGSWCEIRVRGQLGEEWSDWFGGLKLQPSKNGEMVLSGLIPDQGALIGVLLKFNRLNLALTFIHWSQETR